MKNIYRAICALLSALLFSTALPQAASAATWNFGTTPYQHVIDAANWAYSQHNLQTISATELAALVFAVTWPETQGSKSGTGTYTPSPLTMGRSDIPSLSTGSENLFAFDNIQTSFKRAYWHAGMGMWQMDAAGIGAGLGADGRISTWQSARQAADTIASLYREAELDTTGQYPTPYDKRQHAWLNWYACRSNNGYPVKCNDVYLQIYQGGQIVNIYKDASVHEYGGAVWYSCTVPYTTYADGCLFVDVSVAEGAKTDQYGNPLFWYSAQDGLYTYNPDGSVATVTKSPLAAPFYVADDGWTEWRQWRYQDVGAYVYGVRGHQQNDRVTGKWNIGNIVHPY